MLMVGLRNETMAQWLSRREAEEEVEALIEAEASKRGFKKVARTGTVFLFGVKCVETERVDGEWVVTPLDKNQLSVGPDMTRLSKTYRVLPDVARSVIETGVMHEDMHHQGDSVAKIRQKQIERGIMEYGPERFEMLDEGNQEHFILDIYNWYADQAELDSQANKALYDKLLESGMGKQQVTEKLAALVWYVSAYTVADTMPIKERENRVKEIVKQYLNDCLPFLEQKEEAVNKAMDIDRAYQKGLRKLDYVSNPKYRKSFVAAHK